MDTISFSKARAELADLFDKVNESDTQAEIVRRGKPSAVLIGKREYEGMMETLHLLSSPGNAARLHEAKADVKAGKIFERIISGVF